MKGFVDLHCHYVPAVDDGVRSLEDSFALLTGLYQAGFSHVVATPHIRTAMFENRRPTLEPAFKTVVEGAPSDRSSFPTVDLSAEHFYDDVFMRLVDEGEAMPYPGSHAILIEFPTQFLPPRIEDQLFHLNVRGLRPVIAHPERYSPIFKDSSYLERMIEVGALPLLDVMALSGKYGSVPQRTAERILDEGLYYAACSDAHKPADAPLVRESIDRLFDFVGDEEATELLSHHPRHILEGTVDAWP